MPVASMPRADAAVVEYLQRYGVATCSGISGKPITALEGYSDLFQLGEEFAASDYLRRESESFASGSRAVAKKFLVKLDEDEAWTADHPLIRFGVCHELLDSVTAALGEPVRLHSANIWVTLPSIRQEPIYSQQWHRDPEDNSLIKVFLYLRDVDADCGPFQYILESHQRDWDYCSRGTYPTQAQVEATGRERLAEMTSRVREFTGPTGTLVLANTSGLHRGGHSNKLRLNAAWMYTTINSPHERYFQVPAPPANATPDQLFALGF